MSTQKDKSSSTACTTTGVIIAALLTCISTITVAVIANWDKLCPKPTPHKTESATSETATYYPSISLTKDNPTPSKTPEPSQQQSLLDLSGEYGEMSFEKIADDIYVIETIAGTEYPWTGCGIYWNKKIMGVGKYLNNGASFMMLMDIYDNSIDLYQVHLTNNQGDLLEIPSTIRVDTHSLTHDGYAQSTSPISNGIIKIGTADPNAAHPWTGCGMVWSSKYLGIGKYLDKGSSFMIQMDMNKSDNNFNMVYMTDQQGFLVAIPEDILVENHIITR